MSTPNFSFGWDVKQIDREALLKRIADKATDEELDTIARLLDTTNLRKLAMEQAKKQLPKKN